MISSHSLLPKFKVLLEKCPLVRTMVMIEDPLYPHTDTARLRSDVEVATFKSVVQRGEDNPAPPNAHLSEVTMLLLRVPIGYSSPNTMTDLSIAIRRGDKGALLS